MIKSAVLSPIQLTGACLNLFRPVIDELFEGGVDDGMERADDDVLADMEDFAGELLTLGVILTCNGYGTKPARVDKSCSLDEL